MNLDANRDDCSNEQVKQVTVKVLIAYTVGIYMPGLSKTSPEQPSMGKSNPNLNFYRKQCIKNLVLF